METVIHLILFLVSFLLTFKFIKDSNFEKLFKQGKIETILVASIVVSIIGGYLLSESLMKFYQLIITIIK